MKYANRPAQHQMEYRVEVSKVATGEVVLDCGPYKMQSIAEQVCQEKRKPGYRVRWYKQRADNYDVF